MSDPATTLRIMTIDSAVVGFLAEWGNSPLGIAVLTALVLGTLRSIPKLLSGFIRGLRNTPERILMGVLEAIDKRTSSKSDGLL
ncbi:hypothetical protein ABIE00_005188 [Arthrobacter sp. OAP107]